MKIIEHRWSSIEYNHENDLEELYRRLILNAKNKTSESYSPYSNFAVGASVLLDQGSYVSATNQENASYPLCRCAESVVLSAASSQYPTAKIIAMSIAVFYQGKFTDVPVSPCGACRQMIKEQEDRYGHDIALYLYGQTKITKIASVKDILPLCFDGNSLKE